jgi:nicotinate-nucleotide adenylyltransferase
LNGEDEGFPQIPGKMCQNRGEFRKTPLAFPRMRIGLLGGSFNPAHEGHRHISLAAMKRAGLDRVWWLVTPGNPLKSKDELPELTQRVAVARQVASHPRIDVTGFEARLPSPYAIDTIRFLQRRNPMVHFIWLMGGDNLAQIHRWRRWREIFLSIPILVADRPAWRHQALASPAAQCFRGAHLRGEAIPRLPEKPAPAWIYLTLPLSHCSSTAIRDAPRPKNFGPDAANEQPAFK